MHVNFKDAILFMTVNPHVIRSNGSIRVNSELETLKNSGVRYDSSL